MEVKLYKCTAAKEPTIKGGLLKAGASFPNVFMDAERLVNKTVEAYPDTSDEIIALPLCNTLLAEAFGAEVNLGSDSMDPFVESYKYDDMSEFPMDIDEITTERIEIIVEAAKTLADKGYRVSFNLDGPITIIGSVVDPMVLFKSFRKDPDTLKKTIDYVSDLVIKFGRRIAETGISILSYSDSSGTADLIGPKLFDKFCTEPNLRILKAFRDAAEGKKMIVHICGKSTFGLYNAGKIEMIPHDTDFPTYKDAILDIIDNQTFKILGNSCLGKLNLKPFNSQVFEVKVVE